MKLPDWIETLLGCEQRKGKIIQLQRQTFIDSFENTIAEEALTS
jgi:hypothetical protein